MDDRSHRNVAETRYHGAITEAVLSSSYPAKRVDARAHERDEHPATAHSSFSDGSRRQRQRRRGKNEPPFEAPAPPRAPQL
ncbi:hypothetical protein MTO96_026196 [Rhipicephalus appendiculatus]